jgi:hypothetical protein
MQAYEAVGARKISQDFARPHGFCENDIMPAD